MSAYKADLTIEGKVFPLQHCSFSYKQEVKADGSPHAQVQGGTVSIILEEPAPKELIQWMLTPDEKKSGNIRFFEVNNSSGTLQLLEFKDAYCIQLENVFEGAKNDAGSMVGTLVISTSNLIFDGIAFSR